MYWQNLLHFVDTLFQCQTLGKRALVLNPSIKSGSILPTAASRRKKKYARRCGFFLSFIKSFNKSTPSASSEVAPATSFLSPLPSFIALPYSLCLSLSLFTSRRLLESSQPLWGIDCGKNSSSTLPDSGISSEIAAFLSVRHLLLLRRCVRLRRANSFYYCVFFLLRASILLYISCIYRATLATTTS